MTPLERQIAALERFYGLLPAPPHDPFALLVWEVLSSHTTPGKRDAAFAALKRARALTPDSLWKAPQKALEAAVALAGPYREQRLQALRTGVSLFRRNPRLAAAIAGPLRTARRALKPLPQQGDGGAHRMLLFAAGHPVLPIDQHVQRVALRLGYAPAGLKRSPAALRHQLARVLPAGTGQLRRAFLYLSHHGAATCTRSDPHCAVCPLLTECPEGRKRTTSEI